ncbi:MAG: hypothetical protein IJ064_07850 [Bacteroidaceae bacterium]|nr:hypothetical protein [Bacteroidaceae bacterium]
MKRHFILPVLAMMLSQLSASGQGYLPMVYPQQQTAVGQARLSLKDSVYTLSNDLLSASFVHRDGTLRFAGSPEMNLLPGTELFQFSLGAEGQLTRKASELLLDTLYTESLVGSETAVKGAEHFDGKALVARFVYGTNPALQLTWRAVLRDGSHYLRTELDIEALRNTRMHDIVPMMYDVDVRSAGSAPRVSGNTRGAVLVSDQLFAGLETPMGLNTSTAEPLSDGYQTVGQWNWTWTPTSWQQAEAAAIPARVGEVGYTYPDVVLNSRSVTLSEPGRLTVEFQYTSGSHRMNLCGVDLVDANGNVVASDYHFGYTGGQKSQNTYTFNVPHSGTFTLRFFGETKTETVTSSGNITVKLEVESSETGETQDVVSIRGTWSRNVSITAGTTWHVSSVVGMVGQGQQRRSFLAYSERERAVPWRPMPVYISWYELNIDRNNDPEYTTNMNISQCVDVMQQWKQKFFDKYNTGVEAFVWDDGWDQYGTWTFNKNFPNGFQEADEVARQMGSGIGAWLGPVGGYGQSGNYRRQYWNGKGGMQLSNPDYYQTFWDACKYMIDHYDFRFFKFDGISAQFSATGPDSGTTGEENAEAIINLEDQVRRQLKPDIFFNTTVGTWASPFWFHFTDAVWRQENDYGTIGNNSIDRENWITYRDRLVYQNFVQNAPLCPINTLMTHGFILSTHGNVSKNQGYQAVLREMRCAFACGSGMVELYNDYSLMNSINNGKLWADLAECIQWQREQADVLPDIHWVGGNPWDGTQANVYGWAAWNGLKSVLTLRNGSNASQTFRTTLRQALDIPSSVTGSIVLSKAFKVQNALNGLSEGQPIDIDQTLTLTLPGSTVFVFNGIDGNQVGLHDVGAPSPAQHQQTTPAYDLSGRRKAGQKKGLYIQNGEKYFKSANF